MKNRLDINLILRLKNLNFVLRFNHRVPFLHTHTEIKEQKNSGSTLVVEQFQVHSRDSYEHGCHLL